MHFKHANVFLYQKKKVYNGVVFKKSCITALSSKSFIDQVINYS